MKFDQGMYTRPIVYYQRDVDGRGIFKDTDLQVGVHSLFAQEARLPRFDSNSQFQPTLDYPGPEAFITVTHKF